MEMQNLINENLDIILVIGAIILSLMIIKLATKILFRLIIIIVIIIATFIGYQQFSGTNIIDDIKMLYCDGEKSDPIKCACFVKPIMIDLENRFSKEELENLKTKKLRSNTEFIKSYKTKESEIKNCFETLGESSGILEEILNDIKRNGFKILK